MTGITELETLLKSMSPALNPEEYVFCTVEGVYGDYAHLKPKASFYEDEGLTLLLTTSAAASAKIAFESTFKMITLTVHSSLEAVGLTAAVSAKLTEHNISANVIAAYYHDHILVQSERAEDAMKALGEFNLSA
jgi:hypothetical protein